MCKFTHTNIHTHTHTHTHTQQNRLKRHTSLYKILKILRLKDTTPLKIKKKEELKAAEFRKSSNFIENNALHDALSDTILFKWALTRKEKKERKCLWPNTHIKYTQRFVGLSKYNYIRKILNKNHLGKVPSKEAER